MADEIEVSGTNGTATEEQQMAESVQALQEGQETEVAEEEDERLPFPNARVVKIIRETLKQPHLIKQDVKLSANFLLSEILKDISQSMDSEPYTTLSIEHFNRAAKKYKEIALSQKRIRRIKKVLEKQRAELDEIITEIELEMPPEEIAQQ